MLLQSLKNKFDSVMLLSYVVSCIYILILGAYWIYSFASNSQIFHQRGKSPGIIISLVSLSTLLALILSSIIYFCYLRYKLKLNHKQIVSKTMNHCGRGWWVIIVLDILLGVVIFYFTVDEKIKYTQDFIKLHCLFIIMIIFVGSLNGLRWFRLKRAWEIILFTVFLLATGAMYFIDFYFHDHNERYHRPGSSHSETTQPPLTGSSSSQSHSTNHSHQRPQFQHYISGPLIITYEYMFLSLGKHNVPQKIITKLVQYFSIALFIKRAYRFIPRAKPETFFSFDFIWAVIICVMTVSIIIKDIYILVKLIIQRIKKKDRQKYIQEFRAKVRDYLEERSQNNIFELSGTQLDVRVPEDCTVCLSEINGESKITKLDCKHYFHYHCIFEWFNKETVCPMCRHRFEIESVDN